MTVITTYRLTDDRYFHDIVQKQQIYLHHTVGGSAVSTFNYWQESQNRVATAYIVERNGDVYEVFAPENWAWHLGLKTSTNRQANMHSIGIEMASEGALRLGTELNTVLTAHGQAPRFKDEYLYAFDVDPISDRPPQQWFRSAKRLYHLAEDEGKYYEAPETYRDYKFFDAYDQAQVDAVIELVKTLCDRFGVPKRLIPGDKLRFDPTLITGFSGVLVHANIRSDKSDLCGSFPFDKLESALH